MTEQVTRPMWGPFTGRQLTTVAVALIVGLVLVPGTVWAVDSFSNVAIENPSSGAKAFVDAGHHLLVSGGKGALTVGGKIGAILLPPTRPWSVSKNVNSALYVVGPTPATLNITNLTLSVSDASTGTAGFALTEILVPGTAKSCLAHQTTVGVVWSVPHFDAGSPVSMSFPTPLQIRPPAGKQLCLYGTLRTNPIPVTVNGSGYFGA